MLNKLVVGFTSYKVYGTLHKKLRILTYCFAMIRIISFALFTTAWRTMLCEVWLHGRVYGFLTTRD